jgi:hypothetical protein
MPEINCPVCDEVAQDVIVEPLKTIKCAFCGDYDVSDTIFHTGMLKILDRNRRLSALERIKGAVIQWKRPMIPSTTI